MNNLCLWKEGNNERQQDYNKNTMKTFGLYEMQGFIHNLSSSSSSAGPHWLLAEQSSTLSRKPS